MEDIDRRLLRPAPLRIGQARSQADLGVNHQPVQVGQRDRLAAQVDLGDLRQHVLAEQRLHHHGFVLVPGVEIVPVHLGERVEVDCGLPSAGHVLGGFHLDGSRWRTARTAVQLVELVQRQRPHVGGIAQERQVDAAGVIRDDKAALDHDLRRRLHNALDVFSNRQSDVALGHQHAALRRQRNKPGEQLSQLLETQVGDIVQVDLVLDTGVLEEVFVGVADPLDQTREAEFQVVGGDALGKQHLRQFRPGQRAKRINHRTVERTGVTLGVLGNMDDRRQIRLAVPVQVDVEHDVHADRQGTQLERAVRVRVKLRVLVAVGVQEAVALQIGQPDDLVADQGYHLG